MFGGHQYHSAFDSTTPSISDPNWSAVPRRAKCQNQKYLASTDQGMIMTLWAKNLGGYVRTYIHTFSFIHSFIHTYTYKQYMPLYICMYTHCVYIDLFLYLFLLWPMFSGTSSDRRTPRTSAPRSASVPRSPTVAAWPSSAPRAAPRSLGFRGLYTAYTRVCRFLLQGLHGF